MSEREEYKISFTENLFDFIREIEWSWEWIWWAFLMSVLSFILVISGFFIFSDKSVKSYYLKQTNTVGITYTCVYTNAPWDADEIVFCTTDVNQAIEQVKQLNETIK